jgi:DNA replication protein DnaC
VTVNDDDGIPCPTPEQLKALEQTLRARRQEQAQEPPKRELERVDYTEMLESLRSKITLLPDPSPEEQERIEWDRIANMMGIPARLREASFEGQSIPTPALTFAARYMVDDYPYGRCLAMLGPTGVGKTYAAVACLRAARGGGFFYFPHLASHLLSPELRASAMSKATRWKFVVFDDVGTEYLKEGGMLVSILDEIFWTREGNRLATVFTSNLTAQHFRERISDRIADRLRGEWGRVFNVPGESMRKK